MKTIKRFFLGVIFPVLLVVACGEKKQKHEEPAKEEMEPRVVKAPSGIISLETADTLFINYNNRRRDNIIAFESEFQEDGKPFVPTQFISFSIADIQDYLDFIAQETADSGAIPDSLRIYLGNNGEKVRRKKNERRNTVFILPAAKVGNDYGGIFIDAKGKAALIREWIKEYQQGQGMEQKSKASFLPNFAPAAPMLQGEGSLVLNRGGSAPPPNGDF